jgi:hypothetical protein
VKDLINHDAGQQAMAIGVNGEGYREIITSRLRDECLNEPLLTSLTP